MEVKVKKRVVVGLSGGVDSSVSALLLKQEGYEVIGLFMSNWDTIANFENNHEFNKTHQGCESELDYQDAQAVAQKIGIPLYRVEFIKEYWDNVFEYFLSEYQKNRTPNPDILCNQFIKFDSFLNYAKNELQADYIAMGHYARVKHDRNSSFLLKAIDTNKDQTYFLCNLNQNQLQNVLFPIGHLTKLQVRAIAKKHGLITANKKDSTGICFIGERNFKTFLQNYIPNQPGQIINIVNNQIIGHHIGTMYYTIGQRKGLNLGGMNERMFVCDKDIDKKIIYVAPSSFEKQYLISTQALIENINFIEPYNPQIPIMVRFRHRQDLIIVNDFLPIKNTKNVLINYESARAITPGQYAVFYQNDHCIGGGIVSKTNIGHQKVDFLVYKS
ncbi:tRNA 2-thiouridine(34) synthase MnmA [Ureaplasma parvum]|uniref:tRNA-specific 2-thiouridylase MnmA n=3 Tax=Ureaplasma parvum TaxID=134821 RepID=MNMA_UREPA|nr:tRNA 2-thiouridine(34) synthase MnmA [Ureaplasma parvum]B1AJ41.1 RecName: Full=tRNA-specific 2-thiouridylase MnmA [Ureaplasma parvum serovar 3 str. ATCC 27815]Q9PQ88.1 RecName: Full=tRNA-specific 2-thiouridylase MnmA [Ureaplasma parvum serovar 3 str. ATCC 700970]pir/H82896/ tRNA-(5-methylaminomethyl-2-thiouridylate) methyltransferase UU402 [imported] - Ureaplasma urealyticum [Ureaplasma urealyticum]AAF30812.1 tRNA-(5-methylaminomethyl-2-thiouridylate) methyltransferase [Ureaplasma parvum ser